MRAQLGLVRDGQFDRMESAISASRNCSGSFPLALPPLQIARMANVRAASVLWMETIFAGEP